MSLAGRWSLYGHENLHILGETLGLPREFRQAIRNVRFREEIKVDGDKVQIDVHVPSYSVMAHSKEVNFTFGEEREQPLPFGRHGKGIVHKESETKWVAKLSHEDGNATIVRELHDGEMWVHVEAHTGAKLIRKYKRFYECSHAHCGGADKSPFQGSWRLYANDNLHQFLESLGVPVFWRDILNNVEVHEAIHVNGNDVNIRMCIPQVVIPTHHREVSFKFGEPHEIKMPFGHVAQAVGQKVSNTKWTAKLSCPRTLGDAVLTRELVGNEMWTTIEAKGKRIVHKFQRSEN